MTNGGELPEGSPGEQKKEKYKWVNVENYALKNAQLD